MSQPQAKQTGSLASRKWDSMSPHRRGLRAIEAGATRQPGVSAMCRTNVRTAARVAAIAAVLLAAGPFTDHAAASDRVLEIDCSTEREKAVKLGPKEPRVVIRLKNCRCWRSRETAKGYVAWFIAAAQNFPNRSQLDIEADFPGPPAWERTATISGTGTTVLYCYPEASFQQLEAWRDNLNSLYRQ